MHGRLQGYAQNLAKFKKISRPIFMKSNEVKLCHVEATEVALGHEGRKGRIPSKLKDIRAFSKKTGMDWIPMFIIVKPEIVYGNQVIYRLTQER